MRATTKDLRLHSKELLDAVERGEDVTITYRGLPRAKLIKIHNDALAAESDDHGLFGLWSDRSDDVSDPIAFIENLRRHRNR